MSAVHEVNMVVDMGTVGICEKAVIARENQTYFGENLQFSVITLFFGKTTVLVSKQKEIQIFQFD